MNLQLVTLSGVKLDKKIYGVQIPTVDGEIGIFNDHEPLITIAKAGVLQVKQKADDREEDFEYYAIKGGAVQVLDNSIKILVDEAESSDEVIESEAKEALERARSLHKAAATTIEVSEAQAMINHAQARLKIANLKRHKRRNI